MKVKIGNYIDYIGVYQLTNKLKIFGLSDDSCDKIGDYLSNTKLDNLLQYLHSKRKRIVKIKLDKFDSWNTDETIALIALPLLKQLKETSNTYGSVLDEDVPYYLKSKNDYDIDKWNYVLDEMIFAMENIINPPEFNYYTEQDKVDYSNLQDRINRGLILFGKYFQNLWD